MGKVEKAGAIVLAVLLCGGAASAQDAPRVANIGYVSASQILREFGPKGPHAEGQMLEDATTALRYVVEVSKLDLVIQNILFVAPEFDVTGRVITYMKDKRFNEDKVAQSKEGTRVAFLNRRGLVDVLRPADNDFVRLRKEIDAAVKVLAERFGLALVLDEATHCSCIIDITPEVLRQIRGQPVNEAALRDLPVVAARVGVANRARFTLEARDAPAVPTPAARNTFYRTVFRAVADVAKEKKFDVVVSEAVFVSDKHDLSASVLDILGRKPGEGK